MLKRVKYRLLVWLLNDICLKSEDDCKGCMLSSMGEVAGVTFPDCHTNSIIIQARKVWGI